MRERESGRKKERERERKREKSCLRLIFTLPSSQRHSALLTAYVTLECQSVFIYNYVLRIFVIAKELHSIEIQIDNYQKNPNSVIDIRAALSKVSKGLPFLFSFFLFFSLFFLFFFSLFFFCFLLLL